MTTFPLEKSNLKKYKRTENAFLQKIATIPLAQGDGAECECLVKVGDVVSEGDVIGCPAGKDDLSVTSKIHSPIPGKVIAIVPVVTSTGQICHAVQIKLEGKFSFFGKKLEENNWKDLKSSEISEQLYDCGVVNTFTASHAKCLAYEIDQINENTNKKSSAVIVRLFDEDPLRVADALVSYFYFSKIRIAAQICAKAINTRNILYLVSKDCTEEIAKALNVTEFLPKTKKAEENSSPKISEPSEFIEEYVIISSNKYPYAFRREVMNCVNKPFKKNINFNITKDDLYIDAASLLQVYDSIVLKTPSLNKYVHFSGDCLKVSCFLQVKIGTTLREIVNQLGKFSKQPRQIIINGQVTGSDVSSLDVPITKDVKSVIFNSRYNYFDLMLFPCINCGNCRNICPVNISPDILYNSLSINLKITDLQYNSSLLCTDCGLCNTVCPSRLPLSQTIALVAQKFRKGETLEN